MSWITISADDVARRLAAAELSALKTAAKASGQDGDTILEEAINDVTTQVRGYVAACSRNVLGEAGTIPDECKGAALALVRDYLFTRLPAMKALNDELRQKETERATQQLRDVAACKLAIVAPTTPAGDDEQAAAPGITLVASRTRKVTPSTMGGLL